MNTREKVERLVELVEQGKVIEAFDEFYGEDVTMQENSNPPTLGKAANRIREEQFVASIKEVHTAKARSLIVDGNEAVILWDLDYTNTDGVRLRLDQVAHQIWSQGKIVKERFHYDSAAVVQPEVALA